MFGLWVQALSLWSLLSVALHSPAPGPELVEVALHSCREALGSQRCYKPSAPELAAEREAIVATVSWDPEWLSARIELRRAAEPALLAVRTVEFAAADPLEERFRALGLIVAAHVLSELGPPPPARELLGRGFDVFVFGGSALDRGAGRAGLAVRGWMRPSLLPVLLLFSARGAYRPGEPRVLWAVASAGAAFHLEPSVRPFALEGRLEVVGQRTQVVASSEDLGRARTGAFRWGGQLGAEISGRVGGKFWLFAGAELARLRPSLRVRIAGEPAGTEPPFSWGLVAGARLAWP